MNRFSLKFYMPPIILYLYNNRKTRIRAGRFFHIISGVCRVIAGDFGNETPRFAQIMFPALLIDNQMRPDFKRVRLFYHLFGCCFNVFSFINAALRTDKMREFGFAAFRTGGNIRCGGFLMGSSFIAF